MTSQPSPQAPAACDPEALRELLSILAPAEGPAFLHLLACRACRQLARRDLGGLLLDDQADRPASPPSIPWTDEELAALADHSVAAVGLAHSLLDLPASGIRRAAARDPRLCDPLVAKALVFAAEDALDDPARAERAGEAAAALVSELDLDPAGRQLELLLRALWAVLRGHRRMRRLERAEEVYRRALPFLGLASGEHQARAMLLGGVAQLRWCQRRLDEALALFVRAARLFAQAGDRHGEAASRAQAGFVLLEQLDTWGARGELAAAHARLDAALAPALAARVALALAWCELDLGEPESARQALGTARGLYARLPKPSALPAVQEDGERVCRDWWEARIAALAGEPDGADRRLDAVRQRLLASGSVAEAARCTLDLLLQRIAAARLDAISDLGHDLLAAFQHRPPALGPAAMIARLAHLAAGRSPSFAPILAPVRQYFLGLPADTARPDLIAGVPDLADRLLVAASQSPHL
jgi:tetratricopeptide (TPR) repeat protein